MATCPRCGGFLNEQHRCVGLWRLRLRAGATLLFGGIVGGGAGWLVLFVIVGQVSSLAVAVAAGIGVLVAVAWQRG